MRLPPLFPSVPTPVGAPARRYRSRLLRDMLLTATPAPGPLGTEDCLRVDEIVADSMATTHQPGVIVSLTGPRGSYTRAYGSNGARALHPDDHIRIGSVTKMFVGLVVLRLVDAGVLRLSDPLNTYVPGVARGDEITVEHLLSMRAGVAEYMNSLAYKAVYGMGLVVPALGALYSPALALRAIRSGASQFAPGTQVLYTNSCAILAAVVCEKASGTPVRTLLAQLFDELGMAETGWPCNATLAAPVAGSSSIHPDLTAEAGCLVSTAADLTRFARACCDGAPLLSEKSRDRWMGTFWGPVPLGDMGVHPPSTIGYGHFLMSYGSWLGHGGSIRGFTTAVLFEPVRGATVVVSENAQTPQATAFYTIARDIAESLYPGTMAEQSYPDLP